MKRLAAVLLAILTGVGMVPLVSGPAWATDSTILGGYARKDGMTNQLRDSEHPNHVDCINGVCATHTGHSTSSRTISADSTNTLHCIGGVNCITNNTATLTATDTGTGTRSRVYNFADPYCSKTLTGTATATGTVTATGTCFDYEEPTWTATVTVTTSHTWTDTPTATATGTGTKTKTQSYVHFVTVTLTNTSVRTDTGTYTVTAGGGSGPQGFTETMSATGTGTLSATATYTATATEDLIANNPTVALGATLGQGTTNVTFSTGTSTATTTSADVKDNPKIHVATSTQTQTLAFNLPNATKTATVPGTATFVATDFATTATTAGTIPVRDGSGYLPGHATSDLAANGVSCSSANVINATNGQITSCSVSNTGKLATWLASEPTAGFTLASSSWTDVATTSGTFTGLAVIHGFALVHNDLKASKCYIDITSGGSEVGVPGSVEWETPGDGGTRAMSTMAMVSLSGSYTIKLRGGGTGSTCSITNAANQVGLYVQFYY